MNEKRFLLYTHLNIKHIPVSFLLVEAPPKLFIRLEVAPVYFF